MIAPDDPRHGSTRGYHAGCHDACCRAAMTRREKYLKLLRHRGVATSVPACGAQRRIEALMWAGWSATEIATAAGWSHRNAVHRILKGQKGKPTMWLERKTHDAVAAVFRDLWATTPAGGYAARTAACARAKGYLSALVWDDIDSPDATPYVGGDRPNVVDEVVVLRLLAGDTTMTATKPERVEAMRRWLAWGRSEASLCDIHGWKDGRYINREDDVA